MTFRDGQVPNIDHDISAIQQPARRLRELLSNDDLIVCSSLLNTAVPSVSL